MREAAGVILAFAYYSLGRQEKMNDVSPSLTISLSATMSNNFKPHEGVGEVAWEEEGGGGVGGESGHEGRMMQATVSLRPEKTNHLYRERSRRG